MFTPGSRQGFTLIEVIAVFLIFGLLVGGIFAIFTYSSAGFRQAIAQQGLSGELEAVQRRLTYDFRASHYHTVAIVPRTKTLEDGTDVSRTAFSFTTLSDWYDPDRFHPTGQPRWDRQLVYYPTTQESGRLIRQLIDATGLNVPRPYPALSTNISELPNSNSDVLQTTTLSENVLSLEVAQDDSRQLLDITLRLRTRGGQEAGSMRKIDETREAVFSLDALNTYPRL
ncbi:MAG: prepilin-type N-terminal cleavage/methylation domain-containing protein [Vulcanimicrobiota bacterium]